MSKRSSSPNYGFTLIELLAVIAIVSLLSALLFPVFQTTRAKARGTACLSNQRQLGAAINLYTQDYDSLYPNGCDSRQRYSYLWQPDSQDKQRVRTMPTLRSVIHPYVGSDAIWQCPSDYGFSSMFGWYDAGGQDVTLPACESAFETYGVSYLYHLSLTLENVPAPASSGYMDEENPSVSQVGSSQIGVLTDASAYWHSPKDAYPAFVNVLFADGHCKASDDKTFLKAWLTYF